jgi:hypothetical protein
MDYGDYNEEYKQKLIKGYEICKNKMYNFNSVDDEEKYFANADVTEEEKLYYYEFYKIVKLEKQYKDNIYKEQPDNNCEIEDIIKQHQYCKLQERHENKNNHYIDYDLMYDDKDARENDYISR